MEIAEAVTAHQGTITGLATARVAVGQEQIGEADMKRIILAALVGVLVSRAAAAKCWGMRGTSRRRVSGSSSTGGRRLW